MEYALAKVGAVKGIRIYGPESLDERSAVVSFTLGDADFQGLEDARRIVIFARQVIEAGTETGDDRDQQNDDNKFQCKSLAGRAGSIT
jgi:hypothetical protein